MLRHNTTVYANPNAVPHKQEETQNLELLPEK